MAPRKAETIAVARRSVRAFIASLPAKPPGRWLLFPAESPDQRNELRLAAVLDLPPRADARHSREALCPAAAERHDELSRPLQLLLQRLRNLRPRRRHDDPVEGRLIRPAVRAVED